MKLIVQYIVVRSSIRIFVRSFIHSCDILIIFFPLLKHWETKFRQSLPAIDQFTDSTLEQIGSPKCLCL